MANIQSAIKRIRSSKRKQTRNLIARTRARNAVKDARAAIESNDAQDQAQALRAAYRALDKAAAKGVIHKRNAARRKSRLMRQLAKASQTK